MLLVDDLAAGGTKNLRHTPRGLVTLMFGGTEPYECNFDRGHYGNICVKSF